MHRRTSVLLLILLLDSAIAVRADTDTLTLALRTRDPKTNELKTAPLKFDPRKVGVVIVDPWNYHWCITWTEQAGGMTPRMNRALAGARKLGMSVLWGPTDTASMFSGWRQRQRAMAVHYVPVPKVRKADCRWTVPYAGIGNSFGCICGPGIACVMNYGWDGMDPRIDIAESDLIVSGTQELYSICKARGITLLIYFGGATNICLTGKDLGLGPMYAAGLETVFARDLAFAWTVYDPAKGYTPTTGNAQAADDLERSGIPTIVFVDELRKLKLWDESWITEPVRITPSGTSQRPYFFEKSVAVSLDVPFVAAAEIRYTLDGSEAAASSAKYERPLVLDKTTTLRAVAFRGGQKVSLASGGYFVRLPAMPPRPDVAIDRLPSVVDLYAKNGPVYAACLWQPRIGQSYEGKPLRIRGTRYVQGAGMRAPAYLRYDLKPEYRRFVALAGVDDNMLDRELGRNIAMYPSMVFKIFLDGQLAAESPVMRISQAPWRFDVPIPPGSRQIVLVCDDAGSRSPYDLGNWVEAGFVLDGFTPLFNGKDLDGWEGKPGWWRVEDGAITCQSTQEKPCRKCHYLIWRGGKPADFDLRAEFKLVGGNSGIQFRSRELPDFDTAGYQADMCTIGFWYGALHESDRGLVTLRGQKVEIDSGGKKTVTPLGDSAELLKHVKQGDWNEYRIVAKGDEITLWINGVLMSQTIDRQKGKELREGIVALQMHPGPPMKVQFKNIRLKKL